MAQQTTLDGILEAISGDELLREAHRAHFLPGTNQNTEVNGRHVDAPVVTSQQTNPDLVSQIGQSGGRPSLAVHSLQSGGTNSHHHAGVNVNPSVIYASWEIVTLLLQEPQDEGTINSGGHRLGIQQAGQQLESHNDHVQPQVRNPTSHSFDPDVFDDEDDNTFVAQGVIHRISGEAFSPYPEQGQQDGDA